MRHSIKIKKPQKREDVIRDKLEILFNTPFKKIRHQKIINPKTKRRLEFDCYSDKIKIKHYIALAFEIDGEQHYNYVRKFHKTRSDFEYQIEKDKLKDKLAEDNNILLIRIPYYIENIERYVNKIIDAI